MMRVALTRPQGFRPGRSKGEAPRGPASSLGLVSVTAILGTKCALASEQARYGDGPESAPSDDATYGETCQASQLIITAIPSPFVAMLPATSSMALDRARWRSPWHDS